MNRLIDPTPRGNQNSASGFSHELDEAGRSIAWQQLLEKVLEMREAAIRDGYQPMEYPPALAFVHSMCRRPVSLHCLDGSVLIVDADRYMNLAARA